MKDYEILGSFYLGKVYDLQNRRRLDEYFMYDSKDLNTHAVCVGMTGSGKTGLCIDLLEEAAMDNIPALVIDPKGDMSNLLLSFPELRPEDFLPWIQDGEAERKGLSREELAAKTASAWRRGLEEWEQDGERIRHMREKTDLTVYTPGSTAGRPLSILRLIDRPSAEVLNDPEALQSYVSSTVSGLLALLGIEADPLNSREHILLSNILLHAWNSGQSPDLAALIGYIQQPPIQKVGVMPLDTFYPADERFRLAMRFNNLLASPQFASWMQGEPLDISRLLYTESGKPRISILSINHLNDAERMFFVSTFLNQVLSWVRTQPGTGSLRAILYMDEIYGYFPPVANPPSKQPLLTLLKQARAFGLGIMLTTQNPADLDYKGLANIGTWFVGRLQTEQDKNRLLDGLQGASSEASAAFDRKAISDILSNLGSRVFLVNNVHEDRPEIFETRWCMSYLAGPLTRRQIMALHQDEPSETYDPTAFEASLPPDVSKEEELEAERMLDESEAAEEGFSLGEEGREDSRSAEPSPAPSDLRSFNAAVSASVPEDVPQHYLPADYAADNLCYKPSLYAVVSTNYRDAKQGLSHEETEYWNTPLEDGLIAVDWSVGTGIRPEPDEPADKPQPGIPLSELPAAAKKKSAYTGWSRELCDLIYREGSLKLFRNPKTGILSQPGESERDFVIRVTQENREERDEKMEALRSKYERRIDTMSERVRKAEQAVEREKGQASQAKLSAAMSLGSTLLGGLFGRKKLSRTNINKAASSARAAGRAKQQTDDITRAAETLEKYQDDLRKLETELEDELVKLQERYDAANEAVEEYELKPKKADIRVKALALLWLPYEKLAEDEFRPAFRED